MAGASSFTSRLAAHRPVLDRLTFFVALFGVLVVVHLWLQADRGFDRGCLGFSEPDPTFNCEEVTGSEASKLFGVSNIVWGLLFYLTLTALSFAVPLVGASIRSRLKQVRALMIVGGVAYSSYLVYYQATEIGEYCLLCLMSAGVVLALFVLLLVGLLTPAHAVKQPEKMMREATLFTILSVLVLVLVGADMYYFNSLPEPEGEVSLGADQATPSMPLLAGTGECTYNPDIPRYDGYLDLFTFSDPHKGNYDAGVTVIEFFDLNCPHCKSLHPVMNEVVARNSEKARFYFLPYIIRQASIPQTEALYMAAQEGKYFEMIDLQFERQKSSGLGEEDLRAIATELGLDADLMIDRIQRGVYRNELRRRYEQFREIGMTGVPTVMINGQIVTSSSRTVECLTTLIDQAAGTAADSK
jgi:uncharacterized membrane protein/predicted DsbA family dithiol-disulfide isomerase